MKVKNKTLKIILAIQLAVTIVLLCLLIPTSDPTYSALKARADKIFSYDKSTQSQLPNSQIVSLSLALAFRNYKGAEEILNRLEPLIQN